MTNEEIKKALKGSILNAKSVNSKVWSIEICKLEQTLDLINQYEAEIKRLEDAKNTYKDIVDTCEIGAIKKFAEKVNENRIKYFNYIYTDDGFREITNNILQEMGIK